MTNRLLLLAALVMGGCGEPGCREGEGPLTCANRTGDANAALDHFRAMEDEFISPWEPLPNQAARGEPGYCDHWTSLDLGICIVDGRVSEGECRAKRDNDLARCLAVTGEPQGEGDE